MNTNQCCVFIYTYEKSIQIYITYIGINEYRMNRTDERMPKKLKFTLNAHQRKENKKKTAHRRVVVASRKEEAKEQ